MIRLEKNCIVREIVTQREADDLMASGYRLLPDTPEPPDSEGELSGLTVPQMEQMCQEKNIGIPKGTKKKEEFLALLASVQEE